MFWLINPSALWPSNIIKEEGELVLSIILVFIFENLFSGSWATGPYKITSEKIFVMT